MLTWIVSHAHAATLIVITKAKNAHLHALMLRKWDDFYYGTRNSAYQQADEGAEEQDGEWCRWAQHIG